MAVEEGTGRASCLADRVASRKKAGTCVLWLGSSQFAFLAFFSLARAKTQLLVRGQASFEAVSRMVSRGDSTYNADAKRFGRYVGLKARARHTKDKGKKEKKIG